MAKPVSLLRPAMVITPPDNVATVALSTTPVAIDVPAAVQMVNFGATGNFAVAYGTTVCVFPAASTTVGSTAGCEINPSARALGSTAVTTGITVVGTSAGGFLTASFYSKGA